EARLVTVVDEEPGHAGHVSIRATMIKEGRRRVVGIVVRVATMLGHVRLVKAIVLQHVRLKDIRVPHDETAAATIGGACLLSEAVDRVVPGYLARDDEVVVELE